MLTLRHSRTEYREFNSTGIIGTNMFSSSAHGYNSYSRFFRTFPKLDVFIFLGDSYTSVLIKSTIILHWICPHPLPTHMRTKKSRVHFIIMYNDTEHRLSDECVKHVT